MGRQRAGVYQINTPTPAPLSRRDWEETGVVAKFTRANPVTPSRARAPLSPVQHRLPPSDPGTASEPGCPVPRDSDSRGLLPAARARFCSPPKLTHSALSPKYILSTQALQKCMHSSLPPELWLRIFALLDSPALAVCARLSSNFLPLAQARLFAHVYLLPRRRPSATALAPRAVLSSCSQLPDASVKLLRLLSMSPRLAQYIKRLTIVDGTLFPSLHTLPSQSLAMREKLNGAPWFLSASPHVLHELFQSLNLQSFDLLFPDGPKVSWNLIRGTLDLLLSTSPRLHSLHFSNIAFDTHATLRDFTSTLSRGSISHLILHNVKLHRPPTVLLECPVKHREPHSWHAKSFSTRTHDPPLTQNQKSYLTDRVLQLETLCINSDLLYHTHQDPDTLHLLSVLLSTSTNALSPRTLRRLSVPGVDDHTLTEIVRILDECGVPKCSLFV